MENLAAKHRPKDFSDVCEQSVDMSVLAKICETEPLTIRNFLLIGPAGCGKTTVARLIASRAGLPLVVARLDTLVSSLLGSTAKNIRRVFEYASRKRCVLFLDEFDAIAKMRDDKNELG